MVKLILNEHEYEARPGMTLREALRRNGILPETVLATRRGELLAEDEILQEGDEIQLISVISGG
jgi:sulfur carrier protein ThiS